MPDILEQTYELVDIDTLEDYPKNPREGDVDSIAESIEENDFFGACIVQRSTRQILVGNHRRRAARQEGLSQVPVLWVDIDDAHARRIALAENRTNDKAGYKDALLAEVLQLVKAESGSLAGTGFSDDDLSDLLAKINPPTLDEIAAQVGDTEGSEQSFWPRITIQVPQETFDLYNQLIAQAGDGEAHDVFHRLLTCVDAAALAEAV